MRIAYIGPARGTSLHRARALERLGHEVIIIDPWAWLGHSKWVARWLHHTGGAGIDAWLCRRLVAAASSQPDIIWVNDGAFLGTRILLRLREMKVPIVNYSADNPYANGAHTKWRKFREAMHYYDLLVSTFAESARRLEAEGAKNVIRVFLTADEHAHSPRVLSDDDYKTYGHEVSYIAQWAPERGPFLAGLIKLGIPLAIWGDRWNKAREWPLLKTVWRGPGIFEPEGYAKVIQCSKISLCLLYKDAANLHTSRSIEIPALGGLLCAERSAEHMELYEDGREAVFWQDAQECAAVCKHLLEDEPLRQSIARSGHERALRNNHFNEPMLAAVIERAMHGYGARR